MDFGVSLPDWLLVLEVSLMFTSANMPVRGYSRRQRVSSGSLISLVKPSLVKALVSCCAVLDTLLAT